MSCLHARGRQAAARQRKHARLTLKLRILHSIRSVNPAGGGPIEGLKQLSAINQEHGHLIEVLSLDSPEDPWVKTCPLRCHALGPPLGKYGYSSRFVPWL